MDGMARHYLFESTWHVNAPLKLVADVLFEDKDWETWWPGLESAAISRNKASIVGSEVDCIWRAITGYRLKLKITINDYELYKLVLFSSTGHLIGKGSWEFMGDNESTCMRIIWDVHTTKRWMNLFASILRPIFIQNHHHIMRRGEAGLNAYLSAKRQG